MGFATGDGTARAGEDYVAGADTVTIDEGARDARIVVPPVVDSLREPRESFALRLSRAVGARFGQRGPTPAGEPSASGESPSYIAADHGPGSDIGREKAALPPGIAAPVPGPSDGSGRIVANTGIAWAGSRGRSASTTPNTGLFVGGHRLLA